MPAPDSSSLSVSLALDWLGKLAGNYPRFWAAAGQAESKFLAPDIASIKIEKPVYICGLARAGSTVLLEMLAEQPGAVSHRYRDFPFLLTPYWWNILLTCLPRRNRKKHERAHGDRIMVSPESPEAMEEMLWMTFFPHLHHADTSEIFTATEQHPEFESFYRDHIRKLFLVRKSRRYLCKNNYHVTRMAYLQSLFPDARFVIPVREPAAHIASLMRQHGRFCDAGKKDRRIVRQMSLTGHFEFGLNRSPIHAGDARRVRDIREAWRRGDEVTGWALYWEMLYRFVYHQLQCNPALKAQSLIVRFESLCAEPLSTLRAVGSHCGFPEDTLLLERQAKRLSLPDYYRSPLQDADMARIKDITGETAQLFGY